MPHPINPYIAGNPVGNRTAFVGRADIVRDVVQMLRRPEDNAIVLYGQRRIGKTSVLQHLEAQLPTQGNYCPVYFDLQDKATLTLGQVLSGLAQEIAHALKQTKPDLGDDPEVTFRETWLPNVLQSLPKDTALVLLFDEFDVLAAPDAKQAGAAFFPYLRQILTYDPQRLNFIFVIGRNVDDLDNIALSLFKGVDTKHVSLLNQEDTKKLVRLSEANNSLNWSDEAMEYVWQRTNGHAFLTQQLCSHVWETAYDDAPETVPTATPENVENVIFDALDSSRNTLEWLWNGLPPAARVVASALAEAGPKPITEEALEKWLREKGVRVVIRELQNAPRQLQNWDLLEPADGGYRFRVELLRLWIEENKPLKRVQEELERIEPVAENLFRAAQGLYYAEQLEQAANLLRQSIELNPNHVSANQLLADILLAQGQAQEAKKLLERLYEYQPFFARPRLIQALLALAQSNDNEDEQFKIYEQILELDAEQPEAKSWWIKTWQRRGDEAYKADYLEAALAAYNKIANFGYKVAEIEQKIQHCKLETQLKALKEAEQAKHYEDALEQARQLAKEYPDKRDWTADLERLQRQIKLADLYQRALDELKNKDKQTAQALLAQVIRLEPTYEETTRYLHLAVTDIDTFQLQQELQQRTEDFQQLQNKFDIKEEEYKKSEKQLKESREKAKKAEKVVEQIRYKTTIVQIEELEGKIELLESNLKFGKKVYSSIIFGLLFIILIIVIYFPPAIELEYVVSLLSVNVYFTAIVLLIGLLGFLWIIINRLLPCLSVRGEDVGRTVNLLIYDGLDDPSGYSAKKFPITGQCSSKLDGQIRVWTDEGKSFVAEYFRLSREPNSEAPMVTIRYRWLGEEKHKERLLMLSARTPKNLEGLPSGNYMIALGY
jgi:predicted Zn-dependent protease